MEHNKKKFLSHHYRVQTEGETESDRLPKSPENSVRYWKSMPDPEKEKTTVTHCHMFKFILRFDAYFLVIRKVSQVNENTMGNTSPIFQKFSRKSILN